MDRAEIGIGSGLIKRDRKRFVGIQDTRLENSFRADHRVRNVVTIFPGDFCAGRYREGLRAETEVINFHFYFAWRGLRYCVVGFSFHHGERKCRDQK